MVCTGDNDRFRIGGDLYTYDSDDTFLDLDGADKIDMEMFETKIGVNLATTRDAANVQVVLYDDDGVSIFQVITAAS